MSMKRVVFGEACPQKLKELIVGPEDEPEVKTYGTDGELLQYI